MTDESTERGRAKREYLVAGALALAAAVLAVAFERADARGGGHGLELVAIAALAAVMYGRVAWSLLRGGDGSPDAGPPTERMRKMAVVWYLLAGVLGVSLLRVPASVLRGAGPAGLVASEWLAAALGSAIVLAAAGRAVIVFVSGIRDRGGAT